MVTREDDVEIHALARRGWSISAIARHTGHDRKTVRRYLRGEAPAREPAASVLEPFVEYLGARFDDDPHVRASVLLRELRALGFERSYQTLTRELRRLDLRPRCEACRRGGVQVTIELDHEPGEELQLDWLEFTETPWGEGAHVLVGALSHSGQCRGVLAEAETAAHLIEALDALLRRLGGTPRRWRTDRMAGAVATDTGRLLPIFGAALRRLEATAGPFRVTVPTVATVAETVIAGVRDWPGRPIVLRGAAAKYDAFASASRSPTRVSAGR